MVTMAITASRDIFTDTNLQSPMPLIYLCLIAVAFTAINAG